MLEFFGNHTYPIGVDMGDDALTLVQIANGKETVHLHSAKSIEYPPDIKPGSTSWQRWAIKATAELVAHGRFHGKKVIAALPASEVFIDTIKKPKAPEDELQNAIIGQLKTKLRIDPEDVLMEYINTEGDNILVMVTDKTKLYRHLAIYEKAHLKVAAISIWPMAVLKAYTHLWARHVGQDDNPVMLLDIRKNHTNIIICDKAKIFFAHSAPVGAKNLEIDRMADLLDSEMDMCRVRFGSTYNRPRVDQIIFVSGHAVDKEIYTKIAQKAQMAAQIGDCFEAVGAAHPNQPGSENKIKRANWITAMGLSLS